MSKHGVFCNIESSVRPYSSALKFATLAGGYYPLYYDVIAPGDHWILIRCGLHHPNMAYPIKFYFYRNAVRLFCG